MTAADAVTDSCFGGRVLWEMRLSVFTRIGVGPLCGAVSGALQRGLAIGQIDRKDTQLPERLSQLAT